MKFLKQSLSLFLSSCLAFATAPKGFAVQADQSSEQTPIQSAQETQEQLQQLVAPIALYPDALVAQILAAATFPAELVEADRWMEKHKHLEGEKLGKEVDKQPWDPSVKALTEFPSVLANMDKNLAWTSSLGDAYVNQQQDVMNAVQAMRQRAQKAGTLQSNPQETVTTNGQDIVIEPADPEVVYVPQYDPWLVYGEPLGIWPGWYWYPGLYLTGPGFGWGLGFGIGFFGGFGWGWGHWGFGWHGPGVMFNHGAWVSHGWAFANRGFNHGFHPGGFHGGGFHGGGFHGAGAFHGGTHSGAFSGFNHGGLARGFSARGRSSFGGGFHGGGFGGGGFHGGGGGRR